MESPAISLIIRCYNEAEHLGKLLHGIAAQSIQDYEIILVDSGSTDGTVELAEEFGVEQIEYIDPEEFSFGRALNYGCQAASGEYLVIASAHVYPRHTDWLSQLLDKFEDNVALVYGKQRGNEITTFAENQVFKQWFPDDDITRQTHPFCNNANAAIRRELWEQYRYNEQLTGLEDVDWAKRVQADGYDISYASEAEVIHVHDENPREIFNRYRREAYAHKQIMPAQSFSILDFVRLSITHILRDYYTAIGEGRLSSNIVEIPKFRLLQFWGTYRGFSSEGPISDQLWQRFYYPDRETFPQSNNPSETSGSRRRDNDVVDEYESETESQPEATEIDYSSQEGYPSNQNREMIQQ